ncbi:unnamed protein product [Mytilus coruscus]|uniref:Tyr recombinase domain-containing protein n=1 Tax=Mytilus coruscus TaxID=42192 RepID=A0A6J8ACU4_MYTCO|nr:unnamed protein product [Mytilus coruscus]
MNKIYTEKSVKQYQFSRFMGDISRNAGCSRLYTAHRLRATAIQGMNNTGFELRHIMYMNEHKNESSVRSYNLGYSIVKKESLSETLSSISSGCDVSAPKSTSALVCTVSTTKNVPMTHLLFFPFLLCYKQHQRMHKLTIVQCQCLTFQATSCPQDLFLTHHSIIVYFNSPDKIEAAIMAAVTELS